MSFRYYRRYVKGNPQLRIYLPNFYMKLIRNLQDQPLNEISFKVPVQMTEYDARNYLEKIYKLPIKSVASQVRMGKVRTFMGELDQIEDNWRLLHVSLPVGTEFHFPDIEKYQTAEQDEEIKTATSDFSAKRVNDRADVPGWFGI